jgi:CBS domain-containing protein
MKFFTAKDVIKQVSASDPRRPKIIASEAKIHRALEIMFENDYSQLPVEDGEEIIGAISFRTVSKAVKTFGGTDVSQQAVGIAIEEPKFVDSDADIYRLFETLAKDGYVLIGSPEQLEGIMTLYDVFTFLEYQVGPFLLIGEIEESLRELFRNVFDEIEEQITRTFSGRAENDSTYALPATVDEFGFWEYEMFIGKNWEDLEEHFAGDQELVTKMVGELGMVRNALFHFREEAGEVDRVLIEVAHEQIRAAVQSTR